MAGLILHGNSAECTLVANTAKSLLQIKAPTNQRVNLFGLKIMGKQSAGGTDAVVKVRMTRSTANFGTFSAVTPGKVNPANGETIQSTWGGNASVEPTSPTDSGLWWEIQPQSGVIEFIPPDFRDQIPGGQSVQFEFTSTGTPTLIVTVYADE
jgi:hypothetical protein